MQHFHIPFYGLLLILILPFFGAHPISQGFTNNDVNVLKVLLQQLEEYLPAQSENEAMLGERLDEITVDESVDTERPQIQTGLDEAAIREFLSAKNLKAVRNDSSRRTSSCFGRRMDRIGSKSSLGCNTVGRYNQKRR